MSNVLYHACFDQTKTPVFVAQRLNRQMLVDAQKVGRSGS